MMDDTIVRKRGKKIPGTGWKRDPLGPHFCTNFVWGQRFLQMSAALPDGEMQGRARGIPVDFVHAPSAAKPKKTAPEEEWREYRRRQKATCVSNVAAERLLHLRQEVAERKIICAVDGGFTNKTMFRNIPADTTLIGRIRKDSRLFAVPEEEETRRGRKRWYGTALPTPEQIRKDETISWQTVEAHASGKRHKFEVKVLPAVRWLGTGERTVCVIVIRPLAYRPRKGSKLLYRKPVYLLCTDPELPLEEILQSYLWRWEIELNFRDEKTVMGMGEAQVRAESSVETVPSLIVASYAYLLLANEAERNNTQTLPMPKWRKDEPTQRQTTQNMLNIFRSQVWKIAIDTNKTHFATKDHANQNTLYFDNSLSHAACYAVK